MRSATPAQRNSAGTVPMTGWLVVNAFLRSAKFEEIYARLIRAFSLRGVRLLRKTNAELLFPSGTPIFNPPDFVLFWDKDIPLARRLENAGLRLFNSACAIEDCDDKARTAAVLEKHGVSHPKTISAPLKFETGPYRNDVFLETVAEQLKLPLIMKERTGSFGAQVHLAQTPEQMRRFLAERPQTAWLFQEYVGTSFGRDVRIQTLGGQVVAAAARFGAPGDFRSNVTAGGRMEPIKPPRVFCETALAAVRVLNLDFAGVDLIYGEGEMPIVCEVNSNAHFVNLDNALGISFEEMLADHVLAETRRGKPDSN